MNNIKNIENNFIYTNMYLLREGVMQGNMSMIKKRFSNDIRVFVHNYIHIFFF